MKVLKIHKPDRIVYGSQRKLHVPETTLRDIGMWQVMAGHAEVGGIGVVDPDLNVKEVYLCSDHASGIHVQEEETLAATLERAMAEGYDHTWVRLFWHTHILSEYCSFSGIDENAIKEQIVGGMQVVNLLVGSAPASVARLDWLEDGLHVSEPIQVLWHLSTQARQEYFRIQEAKQNAQLLTTVWTGRPGKPSKRRSGRGRTPRLLDRSYLNADGGQ